MSARTRHQIEAEQVGWASVRARVRNKLTELMGVASEPIDKRYRESYVRFLGLEEAGEDMPDKLFAAANCFQVERLEKLMAFVDKAIDQLKAEERAIAQKSNTRRK